MAANPYASFVGDRNPVEVIEDTSRRLSEIVSKLSVMKAPEATDYLLELLK